MKPQAHRKAQERAERMREALRSCRLCPRECGADRVAGEKGFCGLDATARCFREVLHYGEERQLVPSHQVYFAGCNLRCEHCTVAEWNESPMDGDVIPMEGVLEAIGRRRRAGARTLNLLGGEPAVSVAGILQLLALLDCKISVVWNSNMYYNAVVDAALRGLVDVFLADVKCYGRQCCRQLLGVGDYVETVRRNILSAAEHADVIVRVIVLPGHLDCCVDPTMRWLAEKMDGVKVSLRGDYMPPAECVYAPKEYVERGEMDTVRRMAADWGLNVVT
ncbi:MAG: radical SAM protein [Phycisphaerae bacterium]|nr:radical SAM protein [Phycisphaerae bacterium]